MWHPHSLTGPEKELKCIALRVNCAREVPPLLLDLDVRFISPPGVRCWLHRGGDIVAQVQAHRTGPTVHGRVIDVQSAFQHHFFQIAVTQRRAQIPAQAQENEVGLKVTPCERMLALVAHEKDPLGFVFIHCSRPAFYLQHYST